MRLFKSILMPLAAVFAAMSIIALPACSTFGTVTSQPVSAVGDKVVMESTRALFVAELAYNQAANLALIASEAGLLKGDQAARAKTLNTKILAALDRAYQAQSAVVRAQETGNIINLVTELRQLSGG